MDVRTRYGCSFPVGFVAPVSSTAVLTEASMLEMAANVVKKPRKKRKKKA